MPVSKDHYPPGDQVILKSGGPVMTVNGPPDDINKRGQIECIWFDDDERYQSAFFHPAALVVADDGEE